MTTPKNVETLRAVFASIFGNFAMDTKEVAAKHFNGDAKAAYAALVTLRSANLICGEMVNGRNGLRTGANIGIRGEKGAQNITWQCWNTYDSTSAAESAAEFNAKFNLKSNTEKTMTTKTASKTVAAKSTVASKEPAVKTTKTASKPAAKLSASAVKAVKGQLAAMVTESKPAAKVEAKKVEEKKAAKKVATKVEEKAEREVIAGESRITVLVKECPRRGALSSKTFGLYKTGMTVAEWREACAAKGGDVGYLHADIRAGFISVK